MDYVAVAGLCGLMDGAGLVLVTLVNFRHADAGRRRVLLVSVGARREFRMVRQSEWGSATNHIQLTYSIV